MDPSLSFKKKYCICDIDHFFQRLCSSICKIPIRSFSKDELRCLSQLRRGSVWLFLQHTDRLLILPSHISAFWNHGLVFIRPGRSMLMSLAFSDPYRVGLQSIKLRKLFPKYTSGTGCVPPGQTDFISSFFFKGKNVYSFINQQSR